MSGWGMKTSTQWRLETYYTSYIMSGWGMKTSTQWRLETSYTSYIMSGCGDEDVNIMTPGDLLHLLHHVWLGGWRRQHNDAWRPLTPLTSCLAAGMKTSTQWRLKTCYTSYIMSGWGMKTSTQWRLKTCYTSYIMSGWGMKTSTQWRLDTSYTSYIMSGWGDEDVNTMTPGDLLHLLYHVWLGGWRRQHNDAWRPLTPLTSCLAGGWRRQHNDAWWPLTPLTSCLAGGMKTSTQWRLETSYTSYIMSGCGDEDVNTMTPEDLLHLLHHVWLGGWRRQHNDAWRPVTPLTSCLAGGWGRQHNDAWRPITPLISCMAGGMIDSGKNH